MPLPTCAKLLLVVLLHSLTSCFNIVDACSTTIILTSSEGTVSSPTSENDQRYSSNMDYCWLIRTSAETVVIKFLRFDVEICCDMVHIYVNTESPRNTSEKFRLSKPNVIQSEYWMTGTTLVRFKTTERPQRTGFQFEYKLRDRYLVPGANRNVSSDAIEMIRAPQGFRDSHPNFQSASYSNNAVHAWSIILAQNQMVTVRIINFDTETNYDTLKVFKGIPPNIENESLLNLTGPLGDTQHKYFESVTLIFTTDGSEVKSGFRFEFIIGDSPCRMDAVFNGWSGRVSGASFFSLLVRRKISLQQPTCTIESSCGHDPIYVAPTRTWYGSELITIFFNPTYCISGMTCSAGCASGLIKHAIELPKPHPESVRIELINPELWSLTGVTQFRAVSETSCPSVRHRCELRTANGSLLTAQQVKLDVSPPSQPLCLSSVMTQFALVTQPSVTAGSVIACRLLNGTFVEHKLQLLSVDARLANAWEQPLQLATSVAAALALLALSAVACPPLVRAAKRRRRERREAATRAMKMQQTGASCNQYVTDAVINVHSEETEIYVT